MFLITETTEDVRFLTEENNGEKQYFIEGIFMQAETKNRNGRVYPKKTLTDEVQRYNTEYVQKNRAMGELGHPEGPTVNLERVSHIINDLREENSNIMGKAKILDTPYGKIVKNLMDEGAKLGVSSRGMGSLNQKNGANYVRDDFYLATAADIVADPSAPNAFVEGIMEGKEWVWKHGALLEAELEDLKQQFDVVEEKRNHAQEALEFAKFLKSL